MQNVPVSQPWWKTTNPQTLDDRVKAVQDVNDPTIMSDDVLRWSKVVLYALLAFTTLLSGFSYWKFFEHSFGTDLALLMAVLLACIIEFGKNWGFLRVLRIPFFHGWGHIYSTVANTIMWVGLAALAGVTFTASIHNSTKGAEQLSLLLGHEKNRTVFTANTGDIDAQIAATEKRISENRATKWKGTTTVDAQRAIKAETRNLTSLQAQRETRIQQERADFEKESGIKDSQNQFTAGSLMAVGGWVELLQVILMFVRVSAERSLDKTGAQRRGTPLPFQSATQNGNRVFSNYRPIGFNTNPDGNVQAVFTQQPLFQHDQNTVSQSSQTVTQQNTDSQANAVLKLAEKELRGFAANFDRRQGNNSTVAGNIHRILDNTAASIRQPGFVPSYAVWAKFYNYVNGDLLPMLDVKGWPYETKNVFVANLYRIRPPE